MTTKFVDLRRRIAATKQDIAEAARDLGLDVNLDVSRDGVMLYGDPAILNEFEEIYARRQHGAAGDLEDDF